VDVVVGGGRGFLKAGGGKEGGVVVKAGAHAEPQARESVAAGLAFGFVHERARDAAPAMVGMHGEPADVEAAFLLVPEHGAHDDAAVVDDGTSALSEVRVDRVRRLLQGAGRWVALSRLSGKREADQPGERGGIRRFSRPDAPGLRHTTPRSILTPA